MFAQHTGASIALLQAAWIFVFIGLRLTDPDKEVVVIGKFMIQAD